MQLFCYISRLQESVKVKDAELENLRKSLRELQEKAEKAEPLLRLGSPDKLQSLVVRNVSVMDQWEIRAPWVVVEFVGG